MKHSMNSRTAGWLVVAGLAFGAASLPAASSVVYNSQKNAVKLGMSATEIEQILGRPAQVFRFRSASGPTWTYYVGTSYGATQFDVSFGSDGKVISARELTLPSGG